MRAIISLFDFTGRIGRKAFWAGWGAHLLLSVALVAVFGGVDSRWPGGAAILVLLALRLPIIGLQMSIYARRLRDAGQPGWWAVFVLGLYAVMAYICWNLAQGAMDFARECRQTGYDDCGDAANFAGMAALAGLGPLTGFPGPFSLLFAIGVGSAKSRTTRVGGAA